MTNILKKLKVDKDIFASVFSRSSAFYSVIALILVATSFFTYFCISTEEQNTLKDKNASLMADKSSLIDEVTENNKVIASQEDLIKEKNDALDKKDEEIDKIVSENKENSEKNEAAIDEMMDFIGMETNSRSGNDLYDSLDKIDTVSYMLREKFGDSAKLDEHLKYLADLKTKTADELAHFPDCDPLEYGTLTSRFGYRVDPNGKGTKYHSGIDVWNNYGTPIYAAGAGRVVTAGNSGQYGLCVVIDHGYGYKTVYAHCSSLNVSVGQYVSKGQYISKIGATGNATGNHLHFEVQYYGSNVNPLDYVFDRFN